MFCRPQVIVPSERKDRTMSNKHSWWVWTRDYGIFLVRATTLSQATTAGWAAWSEWEGVFKTSRDGPPVKDQQFSPIGIVCLDHKPDISRMVHDLREL